MRLKQAADANGSRLTGQVADVTDEAAVNELVGKILAEHGRVDALVNTVGGYAGGEPLWNLETRVLDQMLALNLRSGFMLARAVVPAMRKRKHGAIVNIVAKAAIDHSCRRGSLRRFQGRGAGVAGFPGSGPEGQRSEGELGTSQHHRYASQPQGDAQR